MNIIVVYDFGYVNGGAAQVAISSAVALKKAGNNVVYFCAVTPLDERLISSGIEVVCTHQMDIKADSNLFRKSIQGIWNFRARKMLRELLIQYSPNDTVVHFHGWFKALSPSVLAIPDQMKFSGFITLHDFFVYCPNGGLYNYQQNIICKFKPMGYRCSICSCDRDNYFNKLWRLSRNYVQNRVLKRLRMITFISISNLSEREFKRCYKYSNSHVVRVNNPVMFPAKINRNEKGDSYLFMGRLSKEKGVELFCEAVTRLGLKGIVLGDGALRESLCSAYPNIEFVGWVSGGQKNKYLQQAKAFVFSSVWLETFGLSVAEMLALGIPCIVGDKTAAAELIENGVNGILYKTGDINSLINAIKNFENTESAYNNFDFDIEDFSVRNHVENLLKVYTS